MLVQSAQRQIRQWLDRRQPLATAETLTQKNIYILPASQSVGFFLVILLLWLVGTNYENNLVLLLSYLLIAVFVSTIFATHANLSGLKVSVAGCSQAFAGEPLTIYLKINNRGKPSRLRLRFEWADAEEVMADIPADTDMNLEISLPTKCRGWLRPGRLKIESSYPLGIVRAWTLPKLSAPALVFPEPIEAPMTEGTGSEGMEGQAHKRGIDDFGGLEAWQPGVPMQRIAWKQYSAGRGLLEKKFEANTSNPEWLDWESYPDLTTEKRLSALCAKALEMERLDQHYGLRIPGTLLPPAQGEAHLIRVLTTLACFRSDDSDIEVRLEEV